MEDIFAYAAKCVDNKGVMARLGHSAKLHSVRSAVSSKGSAVSKFGALVGAGARATLNAIPIPVVGGLLGALEQKVEKAIKSRLHQGHLKPTASPTEKVKFTLKELSVEELDRFRWKVSEAISEYNKQAQAYAGNLAKKRDAQATCDAFLEMAMAAEQVKRRLAKLREACLGTFAALKITLEWIEECENGPGGPKTTINAPVRAGTAAGVNKEIANLRTSLATAIQDELTAANSRPTVSQKEAHILEYHGKCDKWCCFRTAGKPDNWANCKDNVAFVLRHLTEPLVPDSFNNNIGSLWKTE